MKRIAKFHKVSLEQFMEGWKDTFGEQYTEDQIKALYEEIKLPKRATAGSAGYDFYAPDDFVIEPGKTIKRLQRSRLVSVWKWNRTGY